MPISQINTNSIANEAVVTADLANSAVTTVKIADSAITTAKIAEGAVVTADIADGAVTPAKISGMPRITKMQTFVNSTRQTFSVANPLTYWSVTYTKLSATSELHIWCVISAWSNANGGNYLGIRIDSENNFGGVAIDLTGGDRGGVTILQTRTGLAAGNRTISVYQETGNSTSNLLIPVLNPNSSDDARNQQGASVIRVYEVEP